MIYGHLLCQKAKKYSMEVASKGHKKELPLAKSGDNLNIPVNSGVRGLEHIELKITKQFCKMFLKDKRRQEGTWGKLFLTEKFQLIIVDGMTEFLKITILQPQRNN